MSGTDWAATLLAATATALVAQVVDFEWWGMVLTFLVFAGLFGGIIRIARGEHRQPER